MIKKIMLTATILAAVFMVSCTDNANQPTTTTNTETTAITQQTQETTTAQTTAQTTVTPTTKASVPEDAKKFLGTFTVLIEKNNYMEITLDGDVYTAKLYVKSNNSAPSIPVGEYTATFKYDDIHDYGDGVYAVLAKADMNGSEQAFIIDFYAEGDSVSGLSVYINQSGFEMIKGRPA